MTEELAAHSAEAAELVEALRNEVAELRAQLGIRSELDAMKTQIEILRSDPQRVIDVPAMPRSPTARRTG